MLQVKRKRQVGKKAEEPLGEINREKKGEEEETEMHISAIQRIVMEHLCILKYA